MITVRDILMRRITRTAATSRKVFDLLRETGITHQTTAVILSSILLRLLNNTRILEDQAKAHKERRGPKARRGISNKEKVAMPMEHLQQVENQIMDDLWDLQEKLERMGKISPYEVRELRALLVRTEFRVLRTDAVSATNQKEG